MMCTRTLGQSRNRDKEALYLIISKKIATNFLQNSSSTLETSTNLCVLQSSTRPYNFSIFPRNVHFFPSLSQSLLPFYQSLMFRDKNIRNIIMQVKFIHSHSRVLSIWSLMAPITWLMIHIESNEYLRTVWNRTN